MPLPLAPIAAVALRYGTLAIATYTLTRAVERGRRDQRTEDAMDETPEGMTVRREDEQVNGTARMRRVIRLGKTGPGIELDMVSLTRIRFKKV